MELKTNIVKTKVEYNKEDIVVFEKGLYGFEDTKEFIIIDNSENENNPFKWLHAINSELCFVVVDPRQVNSKYDFELEDDAVSLLEANESTLFELLCIVVIPNQIKEMTINLKSPIIINTDNHKAVQIILNEECYRVKHKIIEEMLKGS